MDLNREYILFLFLTFFQLIPTLSIIFHHFPIYSAVFLLTTPLFSLIRRFSHLPLFRRFFNLFRRFPTYSAIQNPPSFHFPLFPQFPYRCFSTFFFVQLFHDFSNFSFLLKIRPPDNFNNFFGFIFS